MIEPVLPCSDAELSAAVNEARDGLWYRMVREVWPEADCADKHWEATVPADVVVRATLHTLAHYRRVNRELNTETARLRQAVDDARRAAQTLVDALPPQQELPL